MQCSACLEGETRPGITTLTLDRQSTAVVFRDVPAEVCRACGERFVTDEVTAVAIRRVEQALARGTELEIIRWSSCRQVS
jgi:YgiT-type zinc finger domain-containing protein